jgi:hypothetical protein
MISSLEQLESNYLQTRALGKPVFSSDFMFVPDKRPEIRLLWLGSFVPYCTPQDAAEVILALGSKTFRPTQLKTYFEGASSFRETIENTGRHWINEVNTSGGMFDGKIYCGQPESFYYYLPVIDCIFSVPDPSEASPENSSQLLIVNGNMKLNYFGRVIAGNLI